MAQIIHTVEAAQSCASVTSVLVRFFIFTSLMARRSKVEKYITIGVATVPYTGRE